MTLNGGCASIRWLASLPLHLDRPPHIGKLDELQQFDPGTTFVAKVDWLRRFDFQVENCSYKHLGFEFFFDSGECSPFQRPRSFYTPDIGFRNVDLHCTVLDGRYAELGDLYVRVWLEVTRTMWVEPECRPVRSTRYMVSKTAPLRKEIKPKVRFSILERDKWTCQTCGATAPEVKLEVDHRVPVVAGGGNEESNLWTLCESCNRGKGGRVYKSLMS